MYVCTYVCTGKSAMIEALLDLILRKRAVLWELRTRGWNKEVDLKINL